MTPSWWAPATMGWWPPATWRARDLTCWCSSATPTSAAPRSAAGSTTVSPTRTVPTCAACCARKSSAALELPRYGLQIIPYEGGCTLMRNGEHLALYDNHDALRREIARHSRRDAESYDRFVRDMLRHCRFIKPLLLREPPDPTSFRPRDIQELLWLGRHFHRSARRACTTRCASGRIAAPICWMSISRARSSRHIWPAAPSSAPRSGRARRAPPTCCCTTTWAASTARSAPGGSPAAAWARSRRRWRPRSRRAAARCAAVRRSMRSWCAVGRAAGVRLAGGEEIHAAVVVSNLDVRRTFLETLAAKAPAARVSCTGAALQDPRFLRQAQHRARRPAALPGNPARLAVHPRRHARDRYHRHAGARLR